METEQGSNDNEPTERQYSKYCKAFLVIFNCILMSVGQVSGPLLSRLYFLKGGKRRWLSACLLTAGFPILILPIFLSYMRARARAQTSRLLITRWLFAASAFLGFLFGIDSFLYSFGSSYLPVSISSLLGSTRLAFTAIFAYVVVRHKFTYYSINAVVLMTFGSLILGYHSNGDRPNGESHEKYVLGFLMTLGAAALHGFIMPAVEYTHLNAGKAITFELAMQVQLLISIFATLFCTVAMIINKDFQALAKEAEEFELGETKYYTVLVLAALALQLLIIGSLGVIFSSTSLLGGLVSSFLAPVQQVFAVIFLHEGYNFKKGMALAMCLCAFASYFYGDYKASLKKQEATRQEVSHAAV